MTQTGVELTLKGEFGQNTRNEFLPTFQMIFVLRGKLVFSNIDEFTTYGQIESQQHNLFCIPPKVSRILADANDEVICINFSTSFLDRYLPNNHPAYQKLTSGLITEEISRLSLLNMYITPEISAILQRLENSPFKGFCDQLLLESKVIELLALQIAQFEQPQTAVQPLQLKEEELERMNEAREILLNHTGEKLSLRTLAHMVGTNEFNLKRNFKIAFGETVFGYLNQYKMEQAKTMLIEKDITIAELSLKMGYKHATHFTSAFKKYFGYLPNKIKSFKLSLLIVFEDLSVVFENFGVLIG
ncbi:AraC family transcriptional regulator [Pedobacter foliorum]|uniref:helix-turn-helix domain-containing protein n=1 Tax=Pedobacter foliorum TaxID=2739058 RepID=UPI0015677065|nr:AraC family transcriptional regulator [Pedobacter foliorum]NRF39670.1 helix-turn-helix transcriptional regulator [Pedobacter foliorum]